MDSPKGLGEKKISRLLWDFSLPAITGMLVNAIYNIVDSIFVGHGVGAIGLAAVTIAFPVMIVFFGFGMLIGVGATTLISIKLGERKKQEAEKILGNAFIMNIVFGIALSAVCLAFLDPILILLGAEPEVLPYARDFTGIILFGSVFLFVGFGLNSAIRAEGHPRIAMLTMIISAILNTLLNPLFIFGMGLGIKGSALATVLSQAVSAAWVLGHFLGPNSYIKLHRVNFILDRSVVLKIMAMGSSSFFMQIAASFVASMFNNVLVIYGGQVSIAAMGVINRISMLMLMPVFGIGQAMQSIVGYNYGAKRFDRVKETMKKAAYAATGAAVAGFILVQTLHSHIMRLFTNDAELIAQGSYGMGIFLLLLPIIGFQVIGAMFFQATGKPMKSLLLSLSRQMLIMVPVLFILPRYFGLTGIWLASPISDLGSTILTAILVFREIRRLNQKKESG